VWKILKIYVLKYLVSVLSMDVLIVMVME